MGREGYRFECVETNAKGSGVYVDGMDRSAHWKSTYISARRNIRGQNAIMRRNILDGTKTNLHKGVNQGLKLAFLATFCLCLQAARPS